MARSKDKKGESESGGGDINKDETKNDEPTLDYDELVKRVCAIANPLAGRKLTKRLYKTVKKGKRRELTFIKAFSNPVMIPINLGIITASCEPLCYFKVIYFL